MKKIILGLLLFSLYSSAGKYDKVRISPDTSYIYVYHKGKAVKIHRIQNIKHKLIGEYTELYKPNKYIQPAKISRKIKTIGEIELLKFMEDKSNSKQGIVIDLREKAQYLQESIPSSSNIPFEIRNKPEKLEKVLSIFGAKRDANGKLDTSEALDIAFYCDGLWSNKSAIIIKEFIKLGYPANKIYYYRGGFQMWKILGLTTVSNN